MHERLVDEHHAVRAGPDLEVEGSVLVCRARGLEQAQLVLLDKVPAVDGAPKGRLHVEAVLVVTLAGVDDAVTLPVAEELEQVVILELLGPVEVKVGTNDLEVKGIGQVGERLEHVEVGEVVALEDRDVLAPGQVEARVDTYAVAPVFLVNHDDARVVVGKLVQDLRRVVGRAVVDADYLYVLERLREQAPHARHNEDLVVVDGHDDGDFGLHRLVLPVALQFPR